MSGHRGRDVQSEAPAGAEAGTLLLHVSSDGRVLGANRYALGLLGPAVIGRPCNEVVQAASRSGHPVCSATCASAMCHAGTMRERDALVRGQRVHLACAAAGDEVLVAAVPDWEPDDLVHVCAWCREVADENGSWMSFETFIGTRYGQMVSHGLCPECAAEVRKSQ